MIRIVFIFIYLFFIVFFKALEISFLYKSHSHWDSHLSRNIASQGWGHVSCAFLKY